MSAKIEERSCKPIVNLSKTNVEDVKVDDILIDTELNEVKVIEIHGKIIYTSLPMNHNHIDCFWTIDELIEKGYKIKRK